ncbi:MAG: 3-deoxy-D-manno-octulosonic acid transferase [Candidatus Omnitrophica bacterium]|nr:3-deoxy-D-manno-octulosonic acid transferase [Candidatus Omnitrophota bacterium]MBU4590779.1 3-deoxy-D-manno-octulosonic acid transferase [Candidatus Omnitrophota bacterium]
MRILYDLVFVIFGIIYLPYLIVTGRYRYGMADKLGILPKGLRFICSNNRIIWIHAVSAGEMKAAGILAPLLRKNFPSHTLVFSSVTQAGNKIARTIAKDKEGIFYFPLDLSFIVNKVVRIIKPDMFLCLEAELWPNLITSLHKANTKIILVNGKISDKSFAGYSKIRFVISRILGKFSLCLMQTEKDSEKILALGAPKDKIFVPGNLKFDIPPLNAGDKRREVRGRLNLREKDIFLVAGSTSRGEEEMVTDCFSRLKKDYNDLRLLIAPRHIERVKEVEGLLLKARFKSMRYSQINTSDERRATSDNIFILDTMGELKTIYTASDIVFVGGSLVKKRGGQNPIEPASLSRPVIFGKFMANYRDVARSFVENNAARQVSNKDELCAAIKLLLDKPGERKNMGMNAKTYVDKNSGSSQRTLDLILSLA